MSSTRCFQHNQRVVAMLIGARHGIEDALASPVLEQVPKAGIADKLLRLHNDLSEIIDELDMPSDPDEDQP